MHFIARGCRLRSLECSAQETVDITRKSAKHEGLDTVDEILQSLSSSGGEMTAAAVLPRSTGAKGSSGYSPVTNFHINWYFNLISTQDEPLQSQRHPEAGSLCRASIRNAGRDN